MTNLPALDSYISLIIYQKGKMASEDERRIGAEILKAVRRLDLPFKLDDITEGRGNCFPLAILSQCRRYEIFGELDESVQVLIYQNDPT